MGYRLSDNIKGPLVGDGRANLARKRYDITTGGNVGGQPPHCIVDGYMELAAAFYAGHKLTLCRYSKMVEVSFALSVLQLPIPAADLGATWKTLDPSPSAF